MPIKHNSYFDSKVQSVESERNGRKFSVGIVATGEYHFGTDAAERMTVISGMLTAKLDGTDEWINYPAGTSFEIPTKSGFDVKAATDTAYQCEYLWEPRAWYHGGWVGTKFELLTEKAELKYDNYFPWPIFSFDFFTLNP